MVDLGRFNLKILGPLILLLLWTGLWLMGNINLPTSNNEVILERGDISNHQKLEKETLNYENKEETAAREILIHIGGGVKNPGVYSLSPETRVVDAILAAGGEKETAALDQVNLARPLQDGERIIIPLANDNVSQITTETAQAKEQEDFSVSNFIGETAFDFGLINLNEANMEELITLTGIGESRAKAIITYREEQGPFLSPEELMAVPGIGPAILAGIIDEVEI